MIETVALCIVLGLSLLVVARVVGKIVSHPDGWRPGLLTFGLRAYCAIFFRVKVRHVSTVPGEGAALVVANHRSPVDPLLMHAAASFQPDGSRQRIVEWLTAKEYCSLPGPIGWITRVARSIPVDREGNDMASVKEAMRRLKEGRIVGIFPEGRINTGEGLLPFNPGLAFLATRGGVPVIPAYIDEAPGGADLNGMVQPFLTRTTAHVRFGPPLDYSHLKRPTAQQREQITCEIREAIIALMPPDKQLLARRRDLIEQAVAKRRLRAKERAQVASRLPVAEANGHAADLVVSP